MLAIVRTTHSIIKFDSSASFKIVPRLERFSGYGPADDFDGVEVIFEQFRNENC